jgi:hypothetical protein
VLVDSWLLLLAVLGLLGHVLLAEACHPGYSAALFIDLSWLLRLWVLKYEHQWQRGLALCCSVGLGLAPVQVPCRCYLPASTVT